MQWENNEVIQRLREYLMIPSVHPDVDYRPCVTFLKQQASQLGLPLVVHEFAAKKPVVVITWTGTQPELPSILLNSHMDVVPVYEEHWTHPPFAAHVTADGWLYARGSLDMKSIGMMHLEAVRNLKNFGVRLKRTVHISFVPDEETGSVEGMKLFAKSPEFDKLNVGFELDESMPNPTPGYIVFYGERTTRQVTVTCKAVPGHGSALADETAGEKIYSIIDKFMKFRAEEKRKLDAGAVLGVVTTVNLTMLQGGVQVNVLPDTLSVSFDVRLAPDVNMDQFKNMIDRWCSDAGSGVTWKYFQENAHIPNTKFNGNPYFKALERAVNEQGKSIAQVAICPGATDARFVRLRGIPAINFSPLSPCLMLLHAHNERIHVDVYQDGVLVMTKVVEAVANA